MRAGYAKSSDCFLFRRCLIVVGHLRFGRVGVGRLAVLGAAFCVTTVVVALVPHAGLIYGLPAQQVALETTASLITLLAGFLIFGRLRRYSRLNELTLVAALAVIALSSIIFGILPMLRGPAPANPAVWAAIIGGSAGSLLFAVAAFVPRAGLRRPRQAQGLAAMGVLGILVLAAVRPRVFGSGLPPAITPSAGPHAGYGLVANPALAIVQITAAVLTV